MKNVLRKMSLIAIILIFSMFILTGCGTSTNKLVGKWDYKESAGKYSKGFKRLEFFSDGTYDSNKANYEGDYSVDGNRIRLNGDLESDMTFTFEIKGNTLTLTDEDGYYIEIFEKASS